MRVCLPPPDHVRSGLVLGAGFCAVAGLMLARAKLPDQLSSSSRGHNPPPKISPRNPGGTQVVKASAFSSLAFIGRAHDSVPPALRRFLWDGSSQKCSLSDSVAAEFHCRQSCSQTPEKQHKSRRRCKLQSCLLFFCRVPRSLRRQMSRPDEGVLQLCVIVCRRSSKHHFLLDLF